MYAMKLQHLPFMMFVATLLNIAHAAESCRPVVIVQSSTVDIKSIVDAGEYCLTQDVKSPKRSSFAEGEYYYSGYMLQIKTPNVLLDLHGRAIFAETSGMGAIQSGYWNRLPSNQKITIRNGSIKSRTRSAIEFNVPTGSLASDFAIHKNADFSKEQLRDILKELPSSADGYEKTEHLIENMKVASYGVNDSHICPYCKAIGMKGASNIIRNSTIEIIDGHAAIYLFGPNQLIENNIIIFKGKAAVESAAAIKLHQADGSIIRNNDIIIESSGDDSPKAAISLIDSKNVLIENNRIYGIKKLTHAWDDKSNSIENNNEFRSMLRRPWTTGAPGVH